MLKKGVKTLAVWHILSSAGDTDEYQLLAPS